MKVAPPLPLPETALQLRQELKKKKFVLIYAHNGTGKTRLSTEFKNIGKDADAKDKTIKGDTVYFNAFTEDLFSWDNDLVEDLQPRMLVNPYSSLISAFKDLEFSDRVEHHFRRYCAAKFEITYYSPEEVAGMAVPASPLHYFYRRYGNEMEVRPKHIQFKMQDGSDWIKISRGEERIFIWSVFLAIIEQVLAKAASYRGVNYLYIDDPISSLDEHNAIMVAHDLTDMLVDCRDDLRVVISTHHVLFYNVVANQLRKKASKWFLVQGETPETYQLDPLDSIPPFHHLSTLVELAKVRDSGELNTQHFSMLRRVLEQTAAFFGYEEWEECLSPKNGESEKAFQKRLLDLGVHGDYTIFQSSKIDEKMRSQFRAIFEQFRNNFPFNTALFGTDSK